jgi:hypothetical protein
MGNESENVNVLERQSLHPYEECRDLMAVINFDGGVERGGEKKKLHVTRANMAPEQSHVANQAGKIRYEVKCDLRDEAKRQKIEAE